MGLPNVGKSTLFNALLKRQTAFVANYPFATIEPNIGVVEVPDDRLGVLAKIVNTNEITIMSIDGKYVHPLKNTDKLLRDYPGTYGGKTGYTEEAGHSLIVAVERNNHKVISVVLKSQSDQFRESRWLLDYIFDVYRWSY